MPLGWTALDPADVLAAADDVRAQLQPPAWHQRAACRGLGTEGFVTRGQGWRVELCQQCPARPDCARTALDALAAGQSIEGLWGSVLVPWKRPAAAIDQLQRVASRL